jgi:RNA recognition motif-containing protein
MLRNLPGDLKRDELKSVLDAHGLRRQYDFIYLPMHFVTGRSFGYAFVNFRSPAAARHCWDCLEGYRGWSSEAVCSIAWSWPHQGLAIHVKLYRNSTVLHESLPDAFKPALYDDLGERRAFPKPQRPLRMPRVRAWPRRLEAAQHASR